MSVAILAIGHELMLGRVVNSNAAWLGNRLSGLGVMVDESRAIGDNFSLIQKNLQELAKHHALILITGGLGPTQDDLTRQAVAALLGEQLVENGPALTHLQSRYAARNLKLTPEAIAQAAIPASAKLLANPVGSAPGFWVAYQGAQLACLPGVPSEMQGMFEQSLLPLLSQLLNKLPVSAQSLTVRLIGIAESQADTLAQGWLKQMRQPELSFGTQLRFPEVQLIFYAPVKAAPPLFATLKKLAQADAAEWLVDFSNTPLESILHDLLRQKGVSLAIAESCSGGAIASRLVALPDASEYFRGGVVSYANQAKEDLLGVSPAILQNAGAVSSECALAMSMGAKERFHADIGVGVTGILGPGGGSYDKPVGLVYLAICGFGNSFIQRFHLERDRLMNREELVVLSFRHLVDFVSKQSQGRIST